MEYWTEPKIVHFNCTWNFCPVCKPNRFLKKEIIMQENNETKVKCKPGQGKLNRLIAKAQDKLRDLGYPERRFKRDYEAGTASYKCPVTGMTAFVNILNREISGSAFSQSFAAIAPTKEQGNG